jgi:hypothetical protein
MVPAARREVPGFADQAHRYLNHQLPLTMKVDAASPHCTSVLQAVSGVQFFSFFQLEPCLFLIETPAPDNIKR